MIHLKLWGIDQLGFGPFSSLFMFAYDRMLRIFNLYKLFLHVMQVVSHFGASWCVTSLSMNYKFEELAQTHPEVLFLYVDVDDVQVNTILLILCPAFTFSQQIGTHMIAVLPRNRGDRKGNPRLMFRC
jgi:thiol-disulfide isomerase/thioredoxin